ncbi:hypothetical protein H9P43_005737 [Blastocladiella emersonii ATCC 22665]|nr:hypothetical protein H9P43_005737 [Blastocladiella emersonii ATCC 22665]
MPRPRPPRRAPRAPPRSRLHVVAGILAVAAVTVALLAAGPASVAAEPARPPTGDQFWDWLLGPAWLDAPSDPGADRPSVQRQRSSTTTSRTATSTTSLTRSGRITTTATSRASATSTSSTTSATTLRAAARSGRSLSLPPPPPPAAPTTVTATTGTVAETATETVDPLPTPIARKRSSTTSSKPVRTRTFERPFPILPILPTPPPVEDPSPTPPPPLELLPIDDPMPTEDPSPWPEEPSDLPEPTRSAARRGKALWPNPTSRSSSSSGSATPTESADPIRRIFLFEPDPTPSATPVPTPSSPPVVMLPEPSTVPGLPPIASGRDPATLPSVTFTPGIRITIPGLAPTTPVTPADGNGGAPVPTAPSGSSSDPSSPPPASPTPDAPVGPDRCGDLRCGVTESCATCPQDCSVGQDVMWADPTTSSGVGGQLSQKFLTLHCASPQYRQFCSRKGTALLAVRGEHPGPSTSHLLDTLRDAGIQGALIFADAYRVLRPDDFGSTPEAVRDVLVRVRAENHTLGWALPHGPLSVPAVQFVGKIHRQVLGADAPMYLAVNPATALPVSPTIARVLAAYQVPLIVPGLPVNDPFLVQGRGDKGDLVAALFQSVTRPHPGIPGWVLGVSASTPPEISILPRLMAEAAKAGYRGVGVDECWPSPASAPPLMAKQDAAGEEEGMAFRQIPGDWNPRIPPVISMPEPWNVTAMPESVSAAEPPAPRE